MIEAKKSKALALIAPEGVEENGCTHCAKRCGDLLFLCTNT